MDFSAPLFVLGSTPYFTSRLIAPVFWISLWANLQESGAFEYLSSELGIFELRFVLAYPEWFAAPQTVTILLILTLIEAAADKSPDAAYFMAAIESEAKAFGSFVFNNAVTVTASLVVVALSPAGAAAREMLQAGLGAAAPAAIGGALVWGFSKLRGAVVAFLLDIDEDDSLGLRRLFSWAEDGWVGLGTLLLVVLPLLSLLISGITLLSLFLLKRYLKAREEGQKVECPHCGELNFPTGIECFQCRNALPRPVEIGFLGQPKAAPAHDLNQHRLALLAARRCLTCAARLPKKSVRQTCEACETQVFPSSEWLDAYLIHVKGKLPRTLGICFLVGLVPVFGLIPGIIYYRFSLISSLQRYIPRGTGCLVRWFIRAINLLLLALQWIPVLGALTLPAMCLVNFLVYSKSLEREQALAFPLAKQQAP